MKRYLRRTLLQTLAVCCLFAGGVTAACAADLIVNPSFESADARRDERPAGWSPELWPAERVKASYANTGRTDLRSVALSCEDLSRGGAGQWISKVQLKPFSRYRFTGWIKTENVTPVRGGGANFVLHGALNARRPAPITGTQDWTKIEIVFNTGYSDGVRIGCAFGDGGQVAGTAWYDDLSMELISSETRKPTVIMDVNDTRDVMSDYIYGQFIEHLGRCIYGGIWAEMLEDRKFFYGVGERESPWRTVASSVVQMSRDSAYVNGHSPAITVTGDVPAGIVQGELALVKGKKYVGRIILAGDRTVGPVEVSLVWGDAPSQRETVTVKSVSDVFAKYPLSYSAKASTENARLEITATGKGTLKVGAVSLMPADNVSGFRADTLKLLKELDSPVYRWPGGNFVSGYDWKDGIGDPDKRPTRKNPAWRGIEPNDVGIHEFLEFCRILKTEPYIAVNTGAGDAKSAAEEVQYVNGSAATPMGKLRAQNGRQQPWNVKWWGVGNEMYGGWQIGHMPVSEYVKKHNEVSKALWEVDRSILLVASGVVGEWDEAMFTHCADYMDYMSEHFYKQDWHPGGLLTHVRQIPDIIRDLANTHRKYRETIPTLKGKNIGIVMDEWNYWYGPTPFGELGTRYFMRDGLGIAAGIHEYSRQSDIYAMANYAQTVNVIGCIKTNKTSAAFETTGLALKMYREHFGYLPITLKGSPEPLDVAAAWSKDRKKLTIAVVNATHQEQNLDLIVSGVELPRSATMYYMAHPDDMAYNDPGKEPVVRIEKKTVAQVGRQLTVPAVSASIFVFDIK